MYLRFIIMRNDPDSGRRQGLFQAIGSLSRANALLAHERSMHEEIYLWFNDHLKVPKSFTKSRKPHAKYVALGWFKDTATEHIARMHSIAAILREHDVVVKIITTDKPGYIVFEDEYQITAEPFSDTKT